ncbi:hypothetical protein B0O80DRAFT_310075 [Mortierella sp. GBAus27b]|nr:hypothetical protein B0O80DRAFT_310075 [Mortierella sp. GBAus27b]
MDMHSTQDISHHCHSHLLPSTPLHSHSCCCCLIMETGSPLEWLKRFLEANEESTNKNLDPPAYFTWRRAMYTSEKGAMEQAYQDMFTAALAHEDFEKQGKTMQDNWDLYRRSINHWKKVCCFFTLLIVLNR